MATDRAQKSSTPGSSPPAEEKGRPYLSPELMAMVRDTQERFPNLCEQNLSNFNASAVRRYIFMIRRQGALEELALQGRGDRLRPEVKALLFETDD